MSDAWLGFMGGILSTLIAALIASLVQRNYEQKKRTDAAQYEIYMRLLEIAEYYFWIASAELRGEEAPEEYVVKTRGQCWKLADKLREYDCILEIESIMKFLFSTSIVSSNDRARLLDKILERYGKKVNPSYHKHIRRLSEENIKLFAAREEKSKAPTAFINFRT
jgi:hypothetical protein